MKEKIPKLIKKNKQKNPTQNETPEEQQNRITINEFVTDQVAFDQIKI
jgi:hypothetical protein